MEKLDFIQTIVKKGDKMVTHLEMFKQSMEPAKKIYTQELKEFAKNYEFLGEMSLIEEPDIVTQDYIYFFDKLNGTKKDVLDKTLEELYQHMIEFSKANGIEEFCQNATICYNW